MGSEPAEARRSAWAFTSVEKELLAQTENGPHVEFRVIVVGKKRTLHPVIRDEIYRIGREAALSAYQIARATNIVVELRYSLRAFYLLVRDNGSGVDSRAGERRRRSYLGGPDALRPRWHLKMKNKELLTLTPKKPRLCGHF